MVLESYLYLVLHVNGKIFKVGKANNVLQRFRQIGATLLRLDNVLAVRVTNTEFHTAEKLVMYIETGICGLFSNAQLTAYEARRLGAPESGKTEWYAVSAFDSVVALLECYAELWGGQNFARK